MDRFNHDIMCDAEEDTDDTEDLPLFGSFGSYSPQYRKHNHSSVQINLPTHSFEDTNTSDGSSEASPTPSIERYNFSNYSGPTTIGKIMATPQLRQIDVRLFIRIF